MQIVIDIPEEVYDALNKNSWNSCFVNDELAILEQAFCNGTILPKGHGKLKDADKLKNRCLYMCNDDTAIEGVEYVTKGMIENAPTVIEADKGEEE